MAQNAVTKSDGAHPMIIAQYHLASEHNHSRHVATIVHESSSPSTKRWYWSQHVKIYEHADEILDICPAKLKVGEGYFVLYRAGETHTLAFTTAERGEDSAYVTEILFPDGQYLCTGGRPCGSNGLTLLHRRQSEHNVNFPGQEELHTRRPGWR
jgi:hypothetical protein